MTKLFFLDFILFIFLNISIFFIWFLFLKKKLYQKSNIDLFLFTFLIFINQILITEFILGIFNVLSGINLFFLNLFIILIVFIKYYKFYIDFLKNLYFNKFLLNIFVTYFKNLNFFYKCLLLIILILIFYILLLIIIFPPHDWDGLYYHLGFVGYVIQEKTIWLSNAGSFWLEAYPKNGEMLSLWTAILLKNGIFVEGIQFLFLLFSFLAIYKIIKYFNFDIRYFYFFILFFIATPIVFSQTTTSYVDLMQVCLFIILLSLFLNLLREKASFLEIFVLGMGSGFLIGIKYFSIIFLFLILLFLFLSNIKIFKKYFILLFLISSIFGSIWYVKNYIQFNNPLYPFKIKILNFDFPGDLTIESFKNEAYHGSNWNRIDSKNFFERFFYVWLELYGWTRHNILYTYDNPYAGFGPQWFIIFLPSFIVSLFLSFLKKDKEFFNLNFIGLLGLFAIPVSYYPRYSIFIIFFGILSFFYFLKILEEFNFTIIKKILILLCLSLSLFSLFLSISMGYFTPEYILRYLMINPIKNTDLSFRGGYFYTCINNFLNEKSVIAYDSKTDFIYPYWNYNFSNKVRYLDFCDKGICNISSFINQLKNLNISYLALKNDSYAYLVIKKNFNNNFKLLCKDENRGLNFFLFLSNN